MPLQVKSKAPLFKAAEKWGKANEQDVLDAVSGTPVLQQELNGCRYKVSQGSPTTPHHMHSHGRSCTGTDTGPCFCEE